MKRFKLASDLWVPAPLDEVWSFGTSPANLARITPEFYNVSIPADARSENGARFTISIKPYGLPIGLKWVTKISEVVDVGDRRQFVDTQETGPFSFWKHLHVFERGAAVVEGSRSESKVKLHEPGTWIRDRVDYALPYGPLGLLAHQVHVRRSLESMFAWRTQKLREIFS